MDDLGGEFLARARSMTEPILPQIQRVLADEVDRDENGTDKGLRRGHDNSHQKSDYDRGKLKLQKARRLSSGGLMRGQRKRRVKYPMQRANTAPEYHSMGNGPEDKRNATKPEGHKSSQLHNQTRPSAAVDKTVESEEHERDLNRETDMSEGKVTTDGSPASRNAESTVTTRSEPFRLDELDTSEIERSQQDSKIDATNRCGDQETTELGTKDSEVRLVVKNTIDVAKTEAVLNVLQTEEVEEDELKVETAGMITKCDIVPSNESEVHQGDLNVERSMLFESSRPKRWSLPTSLRSFETSQKCISTTDEALNAFEFENQRRLSRTASKATIQRSISLPNFVGEKIDDLQSRLPATKVTDNLQCNDEQIHRLSEPEQTDFTISMSEQKCAKRGRSKSWPSALIYLEVPPNKSLTSQRNINENDLQRSKSLSAVDNIDCARFSQEKMSGRYTDVNCEENIGKYCRENRDTEEPRAAKDEKRREFIRTRSKSLPALFTCPGSLNGEVDDGYISNNSNDSSHRQVNAYNLNANKQSKWKSKSLPSVLTGNTAARTTLTKFRELPRVVFREVSSEMYLTETAPKVEEPLPPEKPVKTLEGHVNELTEQRMGILEIVQPNHATAITEQRTPESQPHHATEITEECVRSPESQPNHATEITPESRPNHATEITPESKLNHATEITPESRPNHATEITPESQLNHATEITLESQPNHVTEITEECKRSPEMVQPNRATQPAKHLESTSDSSIIIKHNKPVRRARSTSMPHTCKMERIVEVPSEQELREQDEEYIEPGTTNPQCGPEITQGGKKTNRAWMIGSLGRSRSVDYGDLCQNVDTHTASHAQGTCTEHREEELMLGAEDIELTLTDDFEHDTVNEETQEDFDHRLSKFDDILSNVVSSFLEPDYASSSSSLHRAVAKGDLECVKLLVESGSDVNADDEHGLPALHVAVVSGNYEMAEYLMEAGADLQMYTETVIQEYTVLKQQVYYNL